MLVVDGSTLDSFMGWLHGFIEDSCWKRDPCWPSDVLYWCNIWIQICKRNDVNFQTGFELETGNSDNWIKFLLFKKSLIFFRHFSWYREKLLYDKVITHFRPLHSVVLLLHWIGRFNVTLKIIQVHYWLISSFYLKERRLETGCGWKWLWGFSDSCRDDDV